MAIAIIYKMVEQLTFGNDGNNLLSYINFVIVVNGLFVCFFGSKKNLLNLFREHKFTRNDRILYFFNNFDDYMNEDAQWIQSEKIKPRQKTNPYA